VPLEEGDRRRVDLHLARCGSLRQRKQQERVTRDERCLKRGQRGPERSPVLHTGVQV